MTEPPSGWSAPSGDPQDPAAPPPQGYAPPPIQGYGPPVQTPPAYGAPQYGGPQYGGPQWDQPGHVAPGGWNPQPAWGQPGYGPPAAVQPGVVPLRPLGLGELLDGAIKIIQRYPRPTLGLSAGIALVVTLANVLLILAFDSAFTSSPAFDTSTTTTEFSSDDGAAAAAQLPGFVVSYLGGLVLSGALVVVVGKAVLGQPAPGGEVWNVVKGRLWALLGLSLVTLLILTAGPAIGIGLAVLMGVTGGPITLWIGIPIAGLGLALSVYLYVRLALAAPVLVLERAGIGKALGRSGVLVKGSWWRILGILILTGIIAATISAIVTVPVLLISAVLGGDINSIAFLIGNQIAAGLSSVLVAPFSAGVTALLYVDRRMRAEGLDVKLQAAAAAGTPA